MNGTANLCRHFPPRVQGIRPLLMCGGSGLQRFSVAACLAIAVVSPAVASSLAPGHERVGRTATTDTVRAGSGPRGSEGLIVSLGTALTPMELAPAAGRGTFVPNRAQLLMVDATLIALSGDPAVDPRRAQVADLQSVASLEVPAQLRYLCPDKRYPESATTNRHTYAQCGSGGARPILDTVSTSPFSQIYVSKDPPSSDPVIIPCGATMVSYSFDTVAMNGAALQAQTPQIASFSSALNVTMGARFATRFVTSSAR